MSSSIRSHPILNPVILSKANNQCNRVRPKTYFVYINDQSIEDALHGGHQQPDTKRRGSTKKEPARPSPENYQLQYFERFEDIGNGI